LEQEGKTEKIENLTKSLIAMDPIIHNNYPYAAKLFLIQRGLKIKPNCRIVPSGMQAEDVKNLESIMDTFKQLSEELGIELVRF
jgi:hypothetical protein